MKNYFIFILYWILFIGPAEFIIQTRIIPNGSFFSTCMIYAFLLALYYFFRKKSFGILPSRWNRSIEAFILGLFWLFVMEWLIIGNSPSGNPNALQSSMFIWWVWVFLFPKVFTLEIYRPLRKWLILYTICFTLLFSLPIILGKNPLFFIPIYAYGLWGYYYFLFRYIQLKI